jgi:hypothetical protein
MMKSNQLVARFHRSTRHQGSEPCRNCQTEYVGNYCPQCGQEAHTGAPTAWGFIYELLTRNILERGKLPHTLWRLVRHPGALTVDFLEGRRTRYIRPVRLYIGLSILYFLLLPIQGRDILSKMISHNEQSGQEIDNDVRKELGLHTTTPPKSTSPNQSGKSGEPHQPNQPTLQITLGENGKPDGSDEFNFAANFPDNGALGVVKRRLKHFGDMPANERNSAIARDFLNQAPKAMFFLVPVFALLLKFFFLWRGIPYGAHLLFAFHYHALLFFGALLLFLPMPGGVRATIIFLMCWYLPLALRTTYGCSWFGAIWRWMMMSVLYFCAIVIALAMTLMTSALLI